MPKYITYRLKAVEGLKLGKTNMQIDSQDSMDYVSGSAIRGAFIYKYIRANSGVDINQGEHRKKLLAGGIKFFNAYPIYNENRSIPLPKSYFAPKEKIKAFEDELVISMGLDKSLPQGYEKIRLCEFVGVDENKFTKIKIEKTSNLHINKREAKNKLFRYESIKKGQIFSGIIKAEKDEYVDEIVKLFQNEVVYIGGSKGSGYGKCIIEDIKVLDENPEEKLFIIEENPEYIYLIALSDILYKDELGVYKTNLDEKILELCTDTIEFVDSSIETIEVTSFNNKWNARTPNVVAIKAGSVFKYKIDGDLDKSKLKLLIDNGIGERKAEGYGRIGITTHMKDITFSENPQNSDKQELQYSLSDNEKDILNEIGERIYKARVENKISERVLRLSENLINVESLKPSQWGVLKDLFSNITNLNTEDGKKIYKEFIGHNVEKRGASFKQMSKVEYLTKDKNNKIIGRQDLIEFLDEFMENALDNVYFETVYGDCKVDIEGVENKIDENFIYKTNTKVLSELCRYQIRKEDKR